MIHNILVIQNFLIIFNFSIILNQLPDGIDLTRVKHIWLIDDNCMLSSYRMCLT